MGVLATETGVALSAERPDNGFIVYFDVGAHHPNVCRRDVEER
jgi:hypothetical protein